MSSTPSVCGMHVLHLPEADIRGIKTNIIITQQLKETEYRRGWGYHESAAFLCKYTIWIHSMIWKDPLWNHANSQQVNMYSISILKYSLLFFIPSGLSVWCLAVTVPVGWVATGIYSIRTWNEAASDTCASRALSRVFLASVLSALDMELMVLWRQLEVGCSKSTGIASGRRCSHRPPAQTSCLQHMGAVHMPAFWDTRAGFLSIDCWY